MPTKEVDAFAEKWGFIKTPTMVIDSIKEVKDFTDACAIKGEWNREPIEGFVVRTQLKKGKNASPYGDGSSFFFKVKFDEPYMMYRDWREVTKILLSTKGAMNPRNLPKSKMKRSETKVYVNWVIEEFKRNPDAFKDYTKGKGIIATRENFLAWMQSDLGEPGLGAAEKGDEVPAMPDVLEFGKTIIVPVAIPGCDKDFRLLCQMSY
jgi:tRNA ligase